jgi:hypothetical protein
MDSKVEGRRDRREKSDRKFQIFNALTQNRDGQVQNDACRILLLLTRPTVDCRPTTGFEL